MILESFPNNYEAQHLRQFSKNFLVIGKNSYTEHPKRNSKVCHTTY
jgi:hypothetical protein